MLTGLKIILSDEITEVSTPIPGVGAKKFQTLKSKGQPYVDYNYRRCAAFLDRD